LARTGWLYLRPVIWFTRTKSWLDWAGLGLSGTDLGLAGTVWHGSGVGPRDTGLGGDWPWGCDHGWAASVHVVELLTVLLSFALVLELG
jgi:hypothetical protein